MEIYYEINGKKYLDSYLLRQKLDINKSEMQVILNTYNFPENEVVKLQNRKLYSITILNQFIEKLIENERQIITITGNKKN